MYFNYTLLIQEELPGQQWDATEEFLTASG